jgi:hypothetical protein
LLSTAPLILAGTLAAQKYEDNVTGKQFYAELGGPGMVFSANFDSRFEPHTSLGLGYRIGLGFGYGERQYSDDTWSDYRSYLTIPLGLNYVFGKSNSPHAFEVGGGITLLTVKTAAYSYGERDRAGNVVGHFEFMYRLKPVDGGFTWRIGFSPIVGTGGEIVPSGVVGVGYSF